MCFLLHEHLETKEENEIRRVKQSRGMVGDEGEKVTVVGDD